MVITKYEHACIVVEEAGQRLVIDPGVFSKSLPGNITGVVAIVITHSHQDHLQESAVKQLITNNPDVKIFSTQQVADEFQNLQVTIAEPGSTQRIGAFTLAFFGGNHAIIHESIPPIQNVGVLVNTTMYYPGDSFVIPGRPIKVLALPAAAPWLKISDAINFLAEVKPEIAVPTHDFILSDAGKKIYDRLLATASEKISTKYQRLETGQELTV